MTLSPSIAPKPAVTRQMSIEPLASAMACELTVSLLLAAIAPILGKAIPGPTIGTSEILQFWRAAVDATISSPDGDELIEATRMHLDKIFSDATSLGSALVGRK
jgi:hypothetical protein